MTFKKGLHPGATWKRCDFQVHTPRDDGWEGEPSLPGGSVTAEEARRAWAKALIKVCVDKKIHAIAITDHHDFALFPYVREAAEGTGIWAFPGCEISCTDGVQCIIIFDCDACDSLFDVCYGALIKQPKPDPNTPKAPQVTSEGCGLEIAKLFDEHARFPNLALKSIVLPNASKPGAHKTMFRDNFHLRFANLPADGFYADHAYSRYPEKIKERLYGKGDSWGERRRGVVTTGDNRSSTFEKLGVHECWIRLGEPTAESLRQALLADEARISYTQPDLPLRAINKVVLKSTLMSADAVELSINDGYTAIIGGRGSGKSTLLEYIRFGLGCAPYEDGTGEASFGRQREADLITETNPTTSVDLVRDGVLETWERSAQTPEEIRVRRPDGSNEVLSPAEARARFPVRAFYQRQMSSLIRSPDQADTFITEIVAAEASRDRVRIEEDIETSKQALSLAMQGLFHLWRAEYKRSEHDRRAADIAMRLSSTRQELEQRGFLQQDRNLLERTAEYDELELFISGTFDKIKGIKERIGILKNTKVFEEVKVVKLQEAAQAPRKLSSTLQEIDDLIEWFSREIELASEAARGELSVAAERYAEARRLHDKKLADLRERQQHHSDLLKTVEELGQELTDSFDRARVVAQEVETLVRYRKAVGDAVRDIATLRSKRQDCLSACAGNVGVSSGGLLRASVFQEVGLREARAALQSLCAHCNIVGLDGKLDGMFSELSFDAWRRIAWRMVSLHRIRLTRGLEHNSNNDLVLRLKAIFSPHIILTDNNARRILSRMNDEAVAILITAIERPLVALEYRDVGGFIPFMQASPGQQAAALLCVLLQQHAGALIVDQPEDDLDNRVMMQIAELVRRSKHGRQIIFATHNANLVVNGDADKVVALVPAHDNASALNIRQGNRIEIKIDGAIETEAVRNVITETMEGGRKAFALRGRKYKF